MHLCYFTRWQKSKIEVNLGFLYLFGSVEEYWYPNIAEIKVVGPSLSKKQSECGIYCLWSFKPRNAVLMCSLGLFEYQALKKNIYPHNIPFKGNQRPEVRKRRMRWIQFMSVKCTKWTPTFNWDICKTSDWSQEGAEANFTYTCVIKTCWGFYSFWLHQTGEK